MLKKKFFICLLVLTIVQSCLVLAGLEWHTKIVNKRGEKEGVGNIHLYAQEGNVREEFTKGKVNPLAKEGSYFLYKSEGNMVYLVNPKDKTYAEFPLELMLQSMSSSQMMQITISNAKVDVKKLAMETIGSYKCEHIVINSSYDMKMKVVFMSMEHHIEQAHELWITKDIPIKDVSENYFQKSFKTGLKDLDDLIKKYQDIIGNKGFTVKSLLEQKTTDLKTQKTEHTITEMDIYDVQSKKLDSSLFEIPANYNKVELFPAEVPFGKKK